MLRLSVAAALAAGFALAPLSAPLAARSPADVAEVRSGLLAVAVGTVIQDECDTIRPRMIRVLNLRSQLFAAARAAGFTEAEVDAFVDDKVARANLEAEADQYLSEQGAIVGNAASYCNVGQAEIAAGSAVGRLLRAN